MLHGLDLKIEAGEFVAIMGPSGSGKSTLMNILGCLDKPTRGEYYIDGVLVSKMNQDELADVRNQKIGFVFQGFNLLMQRSIIDNTKIPMMYLGLTGAEQDERAMKALAHVKLTGFETRLPTQISGGMQQRVAIARALVNSPSLLLADEPTGNLDSKTSDEVMKIFTDLNREGKTVVVITHEPDVARYAKRLVYIKDGLIKYDGDVKKFKAGANG